MITKDDFSDILTMSLHYSCENSTGTIKENLLFNTGGLTS